MNEEEVNRSILKMVAAEEQKNAQAKRAEEAWGVYIEGEKKRQHAAMLERVAALRLDNWSRSRSEPLVANLPLEWSPIETVGLAYANVVPYASSPAAQTRRFDPQRGWVWDTVGMQPTPQRGVYLIATSSQVTLNKKPLVLDPEILSGTQSQDLVMFAICRDEIFYLYNPARWEEYISPRAGVQLVEMFKKLKPVLQDIYSHLISGGDTSSGWA